MAERETTSASDASTRPSEQVDPVTVRLRREAARQGRLWARATDEDGRALHLRLATACVRHAGRRA